MTHIFKYFIAKKLRLKLNKYKDQEIKKETNQPSNEN